MVRAGLDRGAVVRVAAELADELGFGRLTLATLAKRLGIALPSLYTHIRSLEHLRQQVSLLASEEIGQELGAAIQGRSHVEALAAIAEAYRAYALRFPGRYAASQLAPDLSDERHAAAIARIVHAIYATLRGYGLEEPEITDAVRMLRSSLHGFVSLEQVGGFALPQSLDGSFQSLVAALDRAFRSWPA
jgi:AcrR family transcriptional regulator